MSLRLLSTNDKILLFASKLYKVGGGEVDSSKYSITKGNTDIPITDININDNTFKIGINPVTGLPYANFIIGEYIDISYMNFPVTANIAEVGYDNIYKLSIPFEKDYYDETTMTSKIRRELDLLEVFNIDEGLYHTDTGFMIIIGDSFKTIIYGSYGEIYARRPDLRDDALGRGGLEKWQLAELRRKAYRSVMNDIQAYKGVIGENFQNLDPDPIIELIAIKTASLYEGTHENDRRRFTYEYQRKIRGYRPEYKTEELGGNLEHSEGIKVKF